MMLRDFVATAHEEIDHSPNFKHLKTMISGEAVKMVLANS